MGKRALDALVVVVFGTAMILLLAVGYWILVPDEIVKVENPTTLAINKTTYFPGEQIVYTLKYCKKRKLPGEVSRALVDGIRVTYNTTTSDLPVGCHEIDVYDLTVPEFTPPGVYHIEGTVAYKVNPLQTFYVEYRTQDFRVEHNAIGMLRERVEKHVKEDLAWQEKYGGSR